MKKEKKEKTKKLTKKDKKKISMIAGIITVVIVAIIGITIAIINNNEKNKDPLTRLLDLLKKWGVNHATIFAIGLSSFIEK